MNKGKLFIIVGVFLILISLTMTFYNKYEDLNAGKQARAALDVFKNEVVVQNHIVESLTTEEVVIDENDTLRKNSGIKLRVNSYVRI